MFSTYLECLRCDGSYHNLVNLRVAQLELWQRKLALGQMKLKNLTCRFHIIKRR